MALETNGTKLANLINPEVMADMVSAKADKAVRVLPYAKVDTTLQGQAGDTISIPKYGYIGEAVDVAEGEDIPVRQMSVSSEQHTIKKAGVGGVLTDEAVLSGYGNPVGELTNQMAKSIAGKCDTDAYEELVKAPTAYSAAGVISYEEIVKAEDLFEEETNTQKAIFIHPKQTTQLRLDPNFIDKSKYGNEVMVNGEIGMVSNTRIVSSKKVRVEGGTYLNPIVKLEEDTETEDASPALTIFLKRDTNVETDRIARNRTTEVTGDKMYVVALTNETKVIVAKMKETATV
jgi:N4-gp56 family major capsid protein